MYEIQQQQQEEEEEDLEQDEMQEEEDEMQERWNLAKHLLKSNNNNNNNSIFFTITPSAAADSGKGGKTFQLALTSAPAASIPVQQQPSSSPYDVSFTDNQIQGFLSSTMNVIEKQFKDGLTPFRVNDRRIQKCIITHSRYQ
jgi:hypothetical protein